MTVDVELPGTSTVTACLSLRCNPEMGAKVVVQSNLRTKDTLGTGLLSFVRRLSLSRRFKCIDPQIMF